MMLVSLLLAARLSGSSYLEPCRAKSSTSAGKGTQELVVVVVETPLEANGDVPGEGLLEVNGPKGAVIKVQGARSCCWSRWLAEAGPSLPGFASPDPVTSCPGFAPAHPLWEEEQPCSPFVPSSQPWLRCTAVQR